MINQKCVVTPRSSLQKVEMRCENTTLHGCLQLLEILKISVNLKCFLEILEISWNLNDAPGKFLPHDAL